MILIKPDHDRRVEIPGVPAPVRCPVDIDQSHTGFANLRRLRIYQFEAGSVINGHAEEDEVFIVMLSRTAQLIMRSENWEGNQRAFVMSAATGAEDVVCAAYLPPRAAYTLTPQSAADVAYARATPVGTRPPKVFLSRKTVGGANVTVLLVEPVYAERLRLRMVKIDARASDVTLSTNDESQAKLEAFYFIQGESGERIATITGSPSPSVTVAAWDTIALPSAELHSVNIVAGVSARLLIVASS
jgi:hypothetical protein